MQPANCLSASAGWLGSASPATSSCGRPPDPAHDGEGRCPGSRPRLNGGVALGRGGELAGAIEGAEVVGELVVHERPRSMLGVNRHPAHWVEREALPLEGAPTGGLEEVDRLGDVAKLAPPARMEEDVAMWGHGAEFATAGYPRRRGTRARDHHLATGGEGGDPGGDVDRRAEPVAVALDAGPVWRPTLTLGKPCRAPTSRTIRTPRAIASRASSQRIISASPSVFTSSAPCSASRTRASSKKPAARSAASASPWTSVSAVKPARSAKRNVCSEGWAGFTASASHEPADRTMSSSTLAVILGQPRPDPARAPRPSVSPCLCELPLIAVPYTPIGYPAKRDDPEGRSRTSERRNRDEGTARAR